MPTDPADSDALRARVVLNPEAGGVDLAAVEELVMRTPGVDLHVAASADETRQAVYEALDAVVERVIAAGGDGTVHAVANVLVESGAEAALGIWPLGTGNDLARTLALPDDLTEALEVAVSGEVRRLDIIRATSDGQTAHAVNAAAGGFSGQVDEKLTAEEKERWGPLAFVLGAAKALPELETYETRLRYDDGGFEAIDAVNVIVANGRTIGGGKAVAPLADPTDGLLDVVVVRWAPLAELAPVGVKLLAGTWLDHPLVEHRRVRSVEVASTPGMRFNVDGELWTDKSLTCRVVPQALRVVVGEAFEASR